LYFFVIVGTGDMGQFTSMVDWPVSFSERISMADYEYQHLHSGTKIHIRPMIDSIHMDHSFVALIKYFEGDKEMVKALKAEHRKWKVSNERR
jgi:hypothetical protein